MNIIFQILHSITTYCQLLISGDLHGSKLHLGDRYKVSDGKVYSVFRETISNKEYTEKEYTLVIGFRLKFIGYNKFFHILFQKLSLLDTPIWVGFDGFKKKYWMVEDSTKDYLGLYRYQGKENALRYAKYITSILAPLSERGSVWYEIVAMELDCFEKIHKLL